MQVVHGQVRIRRSGAAMPGVEVTDGRAWARTDTDGRYTLEAGGPHVWLRRPDGWDCAAWWRPAADAGDFELTPAAARRVSRIAHLSDPHLTLADGDAPSDGAPADDDGTEAALRRALRLAAQHGADVAVVTGDLTDHGTIGQLRRYAEVCRDSPIPVLGVPGNHDHYGHLHEPAEADDPRGSGFLGSATVTRYADVLGPRWWSATVGGVHVIGLDWFSMHCGIDVDEQHAFVVDDLARVAAGTPVLVLSHDQLPGAFIDHLRRGAPHVRLIGTLSGHWHAPKVAAGSGTVHVSTGPTGFGGLDWSPPQIRLLAWDGRTLTADAPLPTIPVPAAPPVSSGRLALGERQHLGNLVVVDDLLLAPSSTSDGTAAVTAVGPDGRVRWRHEMDEAHVTGITVHASTAVAVGCSGTVDALDVADGRRRWTHALADGRRRRILVPPTVSPCGAVIVGDVGHVAALDLDTGAPRWERDDLGTPDTLLTYGSAAATADLAVLPFGGPSRGLVCLGVLDGAELWSDDPSAPWPCNSVVVVDGDDGLVIRGGTLRGRTLLDRVRLRTGQVVWRCELPGGFTTGRPVLSGPSVALVTGDGHAVGVDLGHGRIDRVLPLPGRRRGWAPFRNGGVGAPTGPVELDGRLIVTLIDGSVWDVGTDGALRPAGDVGAPVTTQPAAWAGGLAVLDMTGTLHLVRPGG